MIALEVGEARIYVRPGATDMRKQINGLALIIEQRMESNVFEPCVVLVLQRGAADLEGAVLGPHGVLSVAETAGEASISLATHVRAGPMEIDGEKLHMLLDGIDFWSAHQELAYTRVS